MDNFRCEVHRSSSHRIVFFSLLIQELLQPNGWVYSYIIFSFPFPFPKEIHASNVSRVGKINDTEMAKKYAFLGFDY